MDKASFAAIMANCWRAAGFVRTIDWHELEQCAALHGSADDKRLIGIMRNAARLLPPGHH